MRRGVLSWVCGFVGCPFILTNLVSCCPPHNTFSYSPLSTGRHTRGGEGGGLCVVYFFCEMNTNARLGLELRHRLPVCTTPPSPRTREGFSAASYSSRPRQRAAGTGRVGGGRTRHRPHARSATPSSSSYTTDTSDTSSSSFDNLSDYARDARAMRGSPPPRSSSTAAGTATATATPSHAGRTSAYSSSQRRRSPQRRRQPLSSRPTRPPATSTIRSWSPVGEPAAHLCCVRFWGERGPVTAAAVESPGARTAQYEGCGNLLDHQPHTRWCDGGFAPVVFTFDPPAAVVRFALTTAYCDPSKDPVEWLLEGAEAAPAPSPALGGEGEGNEDEEVADGDVDADADADADAGSECCWEPLHTQDTPCTLVPLERSTECASFKLSARSAHGAATGAPLLLRAVRLTVTAVRGAPKPWFARVRELAVLRRQRLREERAGGGVPAAPASSANASSPARTPPQAVPSADGASTTGHQPRTPEQTQRRLGLGGDDSDDAECTFTPQITEKARQLAKRPGGARSRVLLMEEMAAKGAAKLLAQRKKEEEDAAAASAVVASPGPQSPASARICELHRDAAERKERRINLKAKVQRRTCPDVSDGKVATGATFELLHQGGSKREKGTGVK
eukprot:Rhum_TRINITY_DN13994_c4_g1::Rhum_TRINITY_DN13994_c4_g1_i1::g.66681::m.66681